MHNKQLTCRLFDHLHIAHDAFKIKSEKRTKITQVMTYAHLQNVNFKDTNTSFLSRN